MRVLWFTNTPCGAVQKLNLKTISGGWLMSLEEQLKKSTNIELHIAFYHKKSVADFELDGVHYYPIYDQRYASKINIVLYNYRDYILGFKNRKLDVLKAIVDKVNPDLIHYHGTEQDFGLLQKQLKDIPSVVSIQGVLNSCNEKRYSGLPMNIISKYEGLLSKFILSTAKISEKRFFFLAQREKEILRLNKNIIGRTDFDRHTSLAMSPSASYFIGNELLRKEFYSSVWNKSRFNEVFTIVSTISGGIYKGLEVVLRTALNLKNVNFKFKWIVIGQIESSKDAKIISKYLRHKFSSCNIEMVGRKNANEIIEILKSSDVFCQTGHIENSPNSLCEAMILGIPIIASYAGGTCSMLEHKKEGYLLQDGDSYSLAGTIIDVSRNFEFAKAWGIAARERALLRHDPQRVVKEYLEIYKTIVQKI